MSNKKINNFFAQDNKNMNIRCPDTNLFRILGNFFKNFKNKKILDIGYGNCENVNEFLRREGECFGISLYNKTKLLSFQKKISKRFLHFDLNKIKKLQFKEKFNLIICLDTIYYINDLNSFFCEINKHLKKKGIFVFQYIESQEHCKDSIYNYKNIKKKNLKKTKSQFYSNFKHNPIIFMNYENDFKKHIQKNSLKFKLFLKSENHYIKNKKYFCHKNVYIIVSKKN